MNTTETTVLGNFGVIFRDTMSITQFEEAVAQFTDLIWEQLGFDNPLDLSDMFQLGEQCVGIEVIWDNSRSGQILQFEANISFVLLIPGQENHGITVPETTYGLTLHFPFGSKEGREHMTLGATGSNASQVQHCLNHLIEAMVCTALSDPKLEK